MNISKNNFLFAKNLLKPPFYRVGSFEHDTFTLPLSIRIVFVIFNIIFCFRFNRPKSSGLVSRRYSQIKTYNYVGYDRAGKRNKKHSKILKIAISGQMENGRKVRRIFSCENYRRGVVCKKNTGIALFRDVMSRLRACHPVRVRISKPEEDRGREPTKKKPYFFCTDQPGLTQRNSHQKFRNVGPSVQYYRVPVAAIVFFFFFLTKREFVSYLYYI